LVVSVNMNLDEQHEQVFRPDNDVGALPWKFSQCFGEKTAVEEMTEGACPILLLWVAPGCAPPTHTPPVVFRPKHFPTARHPCSNEGAIVAGRQKLHLGGALC
jgi:hypothetical protein